YHTYLTGVSARWHAHSAGGRRDYEFFTFAAPAGRPPGGARKKPRRGAGAGEAGPPSPPLPACPPHRPGESDMWERLASARCPSVLVSAVGGASLHAKEDRPDKYRSPRATVRTLLTAITVARARPQAIEEAAACLDLSALPADQRNGGLLATQLEAVL